MPRYQTPNPLDLLFFAYDDAARRLGLPAGVIQIHVELGGRLDVTGFKRAVAAIHRVYPATASRLTRTPVRGAPRWRLDVEPPDLDRVVHVHQSCPATEDELQRQIGNLVYAPLDIAKRPPLQFVVFTGLDRGDHLVIRWPHSLMDARGGFLIAEELDRLYRQQPALDGLTSLGDEARDDFAQLTRTSLPGGQPMQAAAQNRLEITLPHPRDLAQLGPVRLMIRRLSRDETEQARALAHERCPAIRFGAFLRAAAIRAFRQVLPPPRPGRACYSIGCLIEGRRPPCRAPICRNLFSPGRIHVPAELAADQLAAASLIHEQTTRLAAAGLHTATLADAARMARLSVGVLGALVRRRLLHGTPPGQHGDMSQPPSIPFGFLRGFTPDMPTFCGTPLSRAWFFRLPQPMDGLPIFITAARGQLTICGPCFTSHAPLMQDFLDLLVRSMMTIE